MMLWKEVVTVAPIRLPVGVFAFIGCYIITENICCSLSLWKIQYPAGQLLYLASVCGRTSLLHTTCIRQHILISVMIILSCWRQRVWDFNYFECRCHVMQLYSRLTPEELIPECNYCKCISFEVHKQTWMSLSELCPSSLIRPMPLCL